jgi:HSP20 family protein
MSTLVRYQPIETSLSDIFSDLLNGNMFSRWNREIEETIYPSVDIVEEKDAFKITADVPGIDKKDISVQVEDNVLTIKGEKKEEKAEKDKNRYYHYERSYGKFSRSFRLPENVDSEHISAKYSNGVLELMLNKTEVSKPKALEVKIE